MIHLWVRATLDWGDEAAFRAQLRPQFAPRVDVWDATFAMPYHEFRRRVRAIAELNHARVDGAVVADLADVPDGEWVLPVDDDDWHAPHAARVIEEAATAAECVRWTATYIERYTHPMHRWSRVARHHLPGVGPKYVCMTNNYAMRQRPERERLLVSHVAASRWVKAQQPGRVVVLDRRLSAMNRTLASTTTLFPHVREPRDLLRRYRRYRTLYEPRRPSGDIAWIRPYVAMMADLMRELEPRR